MYRAGAVVNARGRQNWGFRSSEEVTDPSYEYQFNPLNPGLPGIRVRESVIFAGRKTGLSGSKG